MNNKTLKAMCEQVARPIDSSVPFDVIYFANECLRLIEENEAMLDVVEAAKLSVITIKDGINIGAYRHLSNGDTAISGNNWHKLDDALRALSKLGGCSDE